MCVLIDATNSIETVFASFLGILFELFQPIYFILPAFRARLNFQSTGTRGQKDDSAFLQVRIMRLFSMCTSFVHKFLVGPRRLSLPLFLYPNVKV